MMVNFIGSYTNAISQYNCQKIITIFETSSDRQRKGIFSHGGNIEKLYSEDIKKSTDITYSFFNDDRVTNIIRSGLFSCLDLYKKEYPPLDTCMSPWAVTAAYNIQRYRPGEGYFREHCEAGYKSSERALAWMLYLNDVEDGGTEFPSYNLTTEAEQGKILIWPAYWTHSHRGVVSQTKSKYIATGWFQFI